MKRWDIINYLIKQNNYLNYLEIGVRDPNDTFNRINIEHKDGVDPISQGPEINYPITSDEFFKSIKEHTDIKYDIIFVDGLHTHKQALMDIKNSLEHLKKDGCIVIHDCNPPTEWHQRPEKDYNGHGAWNGTVWKAFVELRCTYANLEMYVVDTDWGCGIIRFGHQKIWECDIPDNCLKYSYLETNRNELLNLINIQKFQEIYKK